MECSFESFITGQTSSSSLGEGVMRLPGSLLENSQRGGERLNNLKQAFFEIQRRRTCVPTLTLAFYCYTCSFLWYRYFEWTCKYTSIATVVKIKTNVLPVLFVLSPEKAHYQSSKHTSPKKVYSWILNQITFVLCRAHSPLIT